MARMCAQKSRYFSSHNGAQRPSPLPDGPKTQLQTLRDVPGQASIVPPTHTHTRTKLIPKKSPTVPTAHLSTTHQTGSQQPGENNIIISGRPDRAWPHASPPIILLRVLFPHTHAIYVHTRRIDARFTSREFFRGRQFVTSFQASRGARPCPETPY